MKRTLGQILLPEKAVRWMGLGLLAAGLMLPVVVLVGRAANLKPAEQVKTGETALRPEMVVLPPGTFLMGSPKEEDGRNDDETLHEVALTQSFAVSRTEISQGHYSAITRWSLIPFITDSDGRDCSFGGIGEGLPMICVNWFEAVTFCNELSRREGLTPAYDIQSETVTWDREADGYRLLTEAEWEYVARAGTRDVWVGTSDVDRVCQHDNVADAKAKASIPEFTTFDCDDGFAVLAPVGAKKPNRWQIFDLGGNAAEWVWDTYSDYSEESVQNPIAKDPSAPSRVVRGGSWGYGPLDGRIANRFRFEPTRHNAALGFRIARTYPLPGPRRVKTTGF